MDSADSPKKSDEKINESESLSLFSGLLQHWYTSTATSALNQLSDNKVWQDQLESQQKLINEAYNSHLGTNEDPIKLWFDLCDVILTNAKDIIQKSFHATKWKSPDDKRDEFINNQIEFLFQPRNFLWSNRDAIETAINSKGKSIQKGFALLSEDLSRGTFNLSPENAFVVGENIAQTSGYVVYKNDLIELIQYEPNTKAVKTNPLLIVPPFINKFYILDLQESNSLVQHLVSQGITVFMISWKNPTPQDGHLTWDDYVTKGVFSSIDTIFDIYPKSRLNISGYCIGGTLAAMSTAILSDVEKERISSLTLLNTLLDFSEVGEISHFISENLSNI
jgi:polyhydroxyalkanoate synthase